MKYMTNMICPKCKLEQDSTNEECPKCGLIFARYKEKKLQEPDQNSEDKESNAKLDTKDFIAELLFSVPLDFNPVIFTGKLLLFAILFVWGWIFILSSIESNYVGTSFLHLVNLPFHEAGHIIFRPFGRIITSMGGSLGQLLMPVVCMLVLLIGTRDPFGASACLWWFGENFLDLAPYINDARALQLPLLGGNTGSTSPYGFHDWEFILNELGLLQYDRFIANLSHKIGMVIILLSFAWGGYLLLKQFRNR